MNYFQHTTSIAWFIARVLMVMIGSYILINVDWVGAAVSIALLIALLLLPFVAAYELAWMIHYKRRHPENN